MARKRDDPQRVLDAFRNLVKALRLADRAGLKRHGLGSAQTFVLHELNRDAPLSINDLASRTATDQSTVSVVVNKLVAKGFVARARSDSDGRRAELILTARGKQLLRKLPPPIQHLLITGVQRLPPAHARHLADMLEQIVGGLADRNEPPSMFFEDEDIARRRR
jgi:MarR family transcriptional regulator, organic hydroperoxide resistance regulator